MIYLIRFLKFIFDIIVEILQFLLMSIAVILLLLEGIILCALLPLLPIILMFQLVEVLIMPITYYIITGKRYYDNYYSLTAVYMAILYEKHIQFSKQKGAKVIDVEPFILCLLVTDLAFIVLSKPQDYLNKYLEEYDKNNKTK